jgi:hypothetical protein
MVRPAEPRKDAVVLAVIQNTDGIKLQVDVVGLDLTTLIDTEACSYRPSAFLPLPMVALSS